MQTTGKLWRSRWAAIGAALAVTFVFLAVAAIAAWVARDKLHEKPRLLDATRTELRRDVAALGSR